MKLAMHALLRDPQLCRGDRIIRAVYYRLFEWAMAVAMIGVGLHLFVWQNSVASSSFAYILEYVPESWLAWFFSAVGIARIVALIINGVSPSLGPKVRAAGSIAAAVIWGQMGLALVARGILGDIPPSPGIAIYAVLVLAELVSTYKAAADVRAHR